MALDLTPTCAAVHPHDDRPCVAGHPYAASPHRTADGRTWQDPHACTMCPVRDADGGRLRPDPDGDVPL